MQEHEQGCCVRARCLLACSHHRESESESESESEREREREREREKFIDNQIDD